MFLIMIVSNEIVFIFQQKTLCFGDVARLFSISKRWNRNSGGAYINIENKVIKNNCTMCYYSVDICLK